MIHTWEEHVDYASLNEALEKIKNIANSLNAGIKVGDTIARVYDIDLALGGQCVFLSLFIINHHHRHYHHRHHQLSNDNDND